MFSDDDNFGGNNQRYSYYYDFDLVKCFQMMIILGAILGISYYHDFDHVKCFQMMIILGVIISVIVIIMTLTL